MLENYCKTVNIEGHTMVDMVRKNYLPAIEGYLGTLAKTASLKKSVSDKVKCSYEVTAIEKLSALADTIWEKMTELEKALDALKEHEDIISTSCAVRDNILPKMESLRASVDEAEVLTSEEAWPFPSYGKLLFSVY